MIGGDTNLVLSLSKAASQACDHQKGTSLARKLHKRRTIAPKSFMNILYNPACPKNDLMSLTHLGVGKLEINSTLALSTWIPFLDTM